MADDIIYTALILARIKDGRRWRHKTQEQLADLIELPRPSLTLIERGEQKLTVATLLRIAEQLHLPAEWLLLGVMQTPKGVERKENAWQVIQLLEAAERGHQRLTPLPTEGSDNGAAPPASGTVAPAPQRDESASADRAASQTRKASARADRGRPAGRGRPGARKPAKPAAAGRKAPLSKKKGI